MMLKQEMTRKTMRCISLAFSQDTMMCTKFGTVLPKALPQVRSQIRFMAMSVHCITTTPILYWGEGLWGDITLNPNDTEALNVYERTKRGDVSGCSFGFEIEKEERSVSEDGTVHYTILSVNPLYEISLTPFPAYEATHVEARHKGEEAVKQRKHEEWVEKMKLKLKGE